MNQFLTLLFTLKAYAWCVISSCRSVGVIDRRGVASVSKLMVGLLYFLSTLQKQLTDKDKIRKTKDKY